MSSGVLLVYIGITLSDCPSVHMSCNPNSSLMDEPILMKLYTVQSPGGYYCKRDD